VSISVDTTMMEGMLMTIIAFFFESLDELLGTIFDVRDGRNAMKMRAVGELRRVQPRRIGCVTHQ